MWYTKYINFFYRKVKQKMKTTTVCTTQERPTKNEIVSKSRKTPDIYIVYNLFEIERFEQTFYGIDVVEMVSGDTVSQLIGDDIDKAKEVFDLLWANYVTPCTVQDIIEDINCCEYV